MRTSQLLIVLTALGGAGCSSTSSVKPPQYAAEWKETDRQGVPVAKGAGECKYEAKIQATQAGGSAKSQSLIDDLYDTCMRQRGY
jgi:hypothetical protein